MRIPRIGDRRLHDLTHMAETGEIRRATVAELCREIARLGELLSRAVARHGGKDSDVIARCCSGHMVGLRGHTGEHSHSTNCWIYGRGGARPGEG